MLSRFNQVVTKMVLNQPWNYMVNGNWNLYSFPML